MLTSILSYKNIYFLAFDSTLFKRKLVCAVVNHALMLPWKSPANCWKNKIDGCWSWGL